MEHCLYPPPLQSGCVHQDECSSLCSCCWYADDHGLWLVEITASCFYLCSSSSGLFLLLHVLIVLLLSSFFFLPLKIPLSCPSALSTLHITHNTHMKTYWTTYLCIGGSGMAIPSAVSHFISVTKFWTGASVHLQVECELAICAPGDIPQSWMGTVVAWHSTDTATIICSWSVDLAWRWSVVPVLSPIHWCCSWPWSQDGQGLHCLSSSSWT